VKKTIAQIDREALPGVTKTLIVDGEPVDPSVFGGLGWFVDFFESPPGRLRGNKLPYWYVLNQARKMGGNAVVLEDDLELCKNAVRRMVTFPVPDDLDWVQFFSPHILQTPTMVPGLWRPPPDMQSFAQAIKFRPETLRALVDWTDDPEFSKWNESDNALRLAAKRLTLKYGAHAPDLVQHVGAVSEANPADGLDDSRTSKQWPGPEFDAMGLYLRDELFR
jgi:hypothetical protein